MDIDLRGIHYEAICSEPEGEACLRKQWFHGNLTVLMHMLQQWLDCPAAERFRQLYQWLSMRSRGSSVCPNTALLKVMYGSDTAFAGCIDVVTLPAGGRIYRWLCTSKSRMVIPVAFENGHLHQVLHQLSIFRAAPVYLSIAFVQPHPQPQLLRNIIDHSPYLCMQDRQWMCIWMRGTYQLRAQDYIHETRGTLWCEQMAAHMLRRLPLCGTRNVRLCTPIVRHIFSFISHPAVLRDMSW